MGWSQDAPFQPAIHSRHGFTQSSRNESDRAKETREVGKGAKGTEVAQNNYNIRSNNVSSRVQMFRFVQLYTTWHWSKMRIRVRKHTNLHKCSHSFLVLFSICSRRMKLGENTSSDCHRVLTNCEPLLRLNKLHCIQMHLNPRNIRLSQLHQIPYLRVQIPAFLSDNSNSLQRK